MGWASATDIMESVLKYADKHKLWANKHVLHIVEELAVALMSEDWDTVNEVYESKTFREACKQSEHEMLQSEYAVIRKVIDAGDLPE